MWCDFTIKETPSSVNKKKTHYLDLPEVKNRILKRNKSDPDFWKKFTNKHKWNDGIVLLLNDEKESNYN